MNDKLNDAMDQIRDEYIADAAGLKKPSYWKWIPAVAAVLAIVILASALLWPTPPGPNLEYPNPSTLSTSGTDSSSAVSSTFSHKETTSTVPTGTTSVPPIDIPPTAATNPVENYLKLYAKTLSSADYTLQKTPDQSWEAAAQLKAFYAKTIPQMLSNANGSNKVYSPVNLYMALCLMAELSDGNQQVLDLLGAADLQALRQQANVIWNASYANEDGKYTKINTLLANSLWLRNGMEYDAEILEILANNYFASAYQADLGSAEANYAIADWINQNTGSLLADFTKNITLSPATIFATVSTVYFKAAWEHEFREENNFAGTFHGTQDIPCTFMEGYQGTQYYWGEDFSAAALSINGSGYMYLFLPAEGKTPEDLLAAGDYLDCIFRNFDNNSIHYASPMVYVTMPKFDIHSGGSIAEDMQALGLTDIFDISKSPFAKFLKDTPAALSCAEQATRVAVDEEGITGASYILLGASGGMPPEDEVELVFDRPFLFVVTDGAIPLFAGIVNDPS